MISFEQACSDTEGIAETTRKSAGGVVSQARALAKAARTGNVAGIRRSQEKLSEALEALQKEVANASSCWPFSDEEEQEIFESQFAGALKAAATERQLKIHERDGMLISFPSIVRILPADRAVRVDRKKISTVRPSFLVDLLLANQKKSSGFSSKRFLESLHAVYEDIVSETATDRSPASGGRVVPLARVYRLMTALPGSTREYARSDFARDLYMLDSNGPRLTRGGAAVSFPSSTGARRRSSDLFSFIGPNGDIAEYYGIRFSKQEE